MFLGFHTGHQDMNEMDRTHNLPNKPIPGNRWRQRVYGRANAGIFASDARDLILEAVEERFGATRSAPHRASN